MAIYLGDAQNLARKMSKCYIGVSGKARQVKKMYIGDASGVARLCYCNHSWASTSTIGKYTCSSCGKVFYAPVVTYTQYSNCVTVTVLNKNDTAQILEYEYDPYYGYDDNISYGRDDVVIAAGATETYRIDLSIDEYAWITFFAGFRSVRTISTGITIWGELEYESTTTS